MANREVLIGHATRFKKGVSRPAGPGRPKGSRDKLSSDFIRDLGASFEKHGAKTLETLRQKDPATYIRVIASLQPKEIEVKAPLSGLDDAKLAQAMDMLQALLDSKQTAPIEPVGPAIGASLN